MIAKRKKNKAFSEETNQENEKGKLRERGDLEREREREKCDIK